MWGIVAYAACSSTLLVINKVAVTNIPSASFVLIAQITFQLLLGLMPDYGEDVVASKSTSETVRARARECRHWVEHVL